MKIKQHKINFGIHNLRRGWFCWNWAQCTWNVMHENKSVRKIYKGLVGVRILEWPSLRWSSHLSLQLNPVGVSSIRLQTCWLSDASYSKLSHLRTLSFGFLLPGTFLSISLLSLNISSLEKTFLIVLSTLAFLWLISFFEPSFFFTVLSPVYNYFTYFYLSTCLSMVFLMLNTILDT